MRLFVALWPPPPVVETLREASRLLVRLAGPTPLRLTRPEHWHVTLRFLGEVDEARVNNGALDLALRTAVDGLGRFTLHLTAPGCFPSQGRPRVFWVGAGGATKPLATLHPRIARATDPFVRTPERTPFHPHLTLARLEDRDPRGRRPERNRRPRGSGDGDASEPLAERREGCEGPTGGRRLREAWSDLPLPAGPPWEVREISLVRSVLGPAGPTYSRLGDYELAGPPEPS